MPTKDQDRYIALESSRRYSQQNGLTLDYSLETSKRIADSFRSFSRLSRHDLASARGPLRECTIPIIVLDDSISEWNCQHDLFEAMCPVTNQLDLMPLNRRSKGVEMLSCESPIHHDDTFVSLTDDTKAIRRRGKMNWSSAGCPLIPLDDVEDESLSFPVRSKQQRSHFDNALQCEELYHIRDVELLILTEPDVAAQHLAREDLMQLITTETLIGETRKVSLLAEISKSKFSPSPKSRHQHLHHRS